MRCRGHCSILLVFSIIFLGGNRIMAPIADNDLQNGDIFYLASPPTQLADLQAWLSDPQVWLGSPWVWLAEPWVQLAEPLAWLAELIIRPADLRPGWLAQGPSQLGHRCSQLPLQPNWPQGFGWGYWTSGLAGWDLCLGCWTRLAMTYDTGLSWPT